MQCTASECTESAITGPNLPPNYTLIYGVSAASVAAALLILLSILILITCCVSIVHDRRSVAEYAKAMYVTCVAFFYHLPERANMEFTCVWQT